eukprot:scaffold120307_cov31-Tisochrysis_lutea.AAC.1
MMHVPKVLVPEEGCVPHYDEERYGDNQPNLNSKVAHDATDERALKMNEEALGRAMLDPIPVVEDSPAIPTALLAVRHCAQLDCRSEQRAGPKVLVLRQEKPRPRRARKA